LKAEWKREARCAAGETVAFVRVEVVPAAAEQERIVESRAGTRFVVRGPARFLTVGLKLKGFLELNFGRDTLSLIK